MLGAGTPRHLAAAAVFVALAIVWASPLASHLWTHLPGGGFHDNAGFLWNFWWMRTALSSGRDFFETTYLFAPTGVDLTLHTHTALPAFAGATLLGGLPVVAAQNLAILISLFLNGFCAYLLAWRVTRDHAAATVGGIVFAGSPYITAHAPGHFNLIAAWPLPLLAFAASAAVGGSRKWAAIAGLILAATAYIDYYYVVYGFALAACLAVLAARRWSVSLRGPSRTSRRLANVIGAVMAVDVALILTVAITGGIEGPIGPIRSIRGIYNPLQALWVLLALFLWARLRPHLSAPARQATAPANALRACLIATAVFLAGAAPLLWKAAGVFLRGDYVTQQYSWRSAPTGVDLATLVLGNPFHLLWGESVQRIYASMRLDVIERSAWLGIAPVLLACWAARRGLGRQWLAIGLMFLLWALGPHLMAFGQDTAMILPQAVLRYIPIVNNARIPGRAIVVAYLALGVLTAIAAAEWRATSRRAPLVALVIALAVAADYVPGPLQLVPLDRPALYDTLRDRPEAGAVVELPLGPRDGFGSVGSFDDRVLLYQTIHQRPLAGGFVARLPRGVTAAYDSDPLLSGLLRLSSDEPGHDAPVLPDRQAATGRLAASGIRFVVLDRRRASAALIQYVDQVLPLTLIAEGDARSLYLVAP